MNTLRHRFTIIAITPMLLAIAVIASLACGAEGTVYDFGTPEPNTIGDYDREQAYRAIPTPTPVIPHTMTDAYWFYAKQLPSLNEAERWYNTKAMASKAYTTTYPLRCEAAYHEFIAAIAAGWDPQHHQRVIDDAVDEIDRLICNTPVGYDHGSEPGHIIAQGISNLMAEIEPQQSDQTTASPKQNPSLQPDKLHSP